ncbi:hypothetical protein ALP73_01089 [Pseudomonas coronafaciens pv. garcae]|nr:hypothetical protein ALP73_01089 [Pseudomonas coronafaciens pv. garcae]
MLANEVKNAAEQIQQSFTHGQIAQLVRLISPTSTCALMSSQDFERVMSLMSGQSRHRAFSEKSMKSARLVLVMGASVSEAAAETGLARAVVHRLMARIRARMQGLPGDWVKVEGWLPPAAAADFFESVKTFRSAYEQDKCAALEAHTAVKIDV